MVVKCVSSKLNVKLNGEEIIDIDLSKSDASKNKPLEGYIGLQDHGEPNNVFFRNIKLVEIK